MTRHTMHRIAILAALAPCLFLSSCGKPMDLGTWTNGQYHNKYFAFSINAPDGWEPASRETIRKLSRVGAKFLSAKDKDLAKALEKGDISSYQLFMFSEHEIAPDTEFNHNMVCSMDRISHIRRIKTAADFQREMVKLLRRVGIKLKNAQGEPVTVGSNDFHMMAGTLSVGHVDVYQEYYSIVKNGYALTFIISYSEGHPSYETVREALETLTFFD